MARTPSDSIIRNATIADPYAPLLPNPIEATFHIRNDKVTLELRGRGCVYSVYMTPGSLREFLIAGADALTSYDPAALTQLRIIK